MTVGELIAERYHIEEHVGTGGMSSVFRAHDTLLERSVALKILHEQFSSDDDYVERFGREARSVAQLSHPNIVTVIDRGEEDGRPFIVFEYVNGENLKDLVDREGPLPVRDALELGIQIGRALAFAHENGLVHRDVKPQNVLLDEDGRARVTDFGIARSLDVEGLTITGTVMGTSNYIAPEQAGGERVDARTDIYSLGVVLYELLVGEAPYPGDTFVAVAMRHINDPVPVVADRRPDVPPHVDAALQRAMAKRPEDRFETMADFVAELEACLREVDGVEGQTLVVDRPLVAPPRREGRARPRGILPLALAIVIAAAVAGAVIAVLSYSDNLGTGPLRSGGASVAVKLSGLSGYDPEGADGEHDGEAKNATDGSATSYWTTEHYGSTSFGNLKDGVGLLLDAGKQVSPKKLVITTDTPGFKAEIRAGSSSEGEFTKVADSQTVGDKTTFSLSGDPARYYVVWITELGDGNVAHINEVKAG